MPRGSIPERTTLKKDMTDPMLRRISTIYIRIQSIYSRETGCYVSYRIVSYCIVLYCIVLCCILGNLASFQNCALLLQSVSGCCCRGLLRRAGAVFSNNVSRDHFQSISKRLAHRWLLPGASANWKPVFQNTHIDWALIIISKRLLPSVAGCCRRGLLRRA